MMLTRVLLATLCLYQIVSSSCPLKNGTLELVYHAPVVNNKYSVESLTDGVFATGTSYKGKPACYQSWHINPYATFTMDAPLSVQTIRILMRRLWKGNNVDYFTQLVLGNTLKVCDRYFQKCSPPCSLIGSVKMGDWNVWDCKGAVGPGVYLANNSRIRGHRLVGCEIIVTGCPAEI